jgi:hypothetical protein
MDNGQNVMLLLALITGISSLVLGILNRIKHSECSSCCEIDTKTAPPTPSGVFETKPILQPKTSNI